MSKSEIIYNWLHKKYTRKINLDRKRILKILIKLNNPHLKLKNPINFIGSDGKFTSAISLNYFLEANKNNSTTSEYGMDQPSRKPLRDSVLVPSVSEENFFKRKQKYNEEPIASEMIIEFSPNNFEVPVPGRELNSEKDISMDGPKFNSEGVE